MQDLHDYLKRMSPAEQRDFAERCKASLGYLKKAIFAKCRLSDALCIRIEVQSQGVVTRKSLRPDVDWDAYGSWGQPAAINLISQDACNAR